MRFKMISVLLVFLYLAATTDGETVLEQTVKDLLDQFKTFRKEVTRQIMLQQLSFEERIRSDADSGIKQVRHNDDGTKIYYADTHTTPTRVLSVHDHANNIRTVGMGEFIGVLNGVEFRTRHNDYRLYMPSKSSSEWHATEEIPFPEVPPEVKNKPTVDEEIAEMREWFKAWRDQDHTVRDYRKYFKPVLCYLEGAWTTETSGAIDEPFSSDRHFIDASSWFDLQEKIRFTSYTGRKDNLENFSFLPTTIMNVTEDGIPQFAQWNYRILCHPLSRDVPLNRLRVIDELHPRLAGKRTYEQHVNTRAARFQLNPADTDTWKEGFNDPKKWSLLDELMSEIPGKDNYPGKLTDEAFELPVYHINSDSDRDKKLNTAYYNRLFKVHKKGAMGLQVRHRGFADANLFMAMTAQSKVTGITINGKPCKWSKELRQRVCPVYHQKWSYAIPLEIIYMTPLNRWNPYHLVYKGDYGTTFAKTVEGGGRNGVKTVQKAYDGTNSKRYYNTPHSFFSGKEVATDKADTTKDVVGVLDKNGNLQIVRASGIRVFLPDIPDVGVLRQRYPIAPVHGEGSSVWKELEAVKDILLHSQTHRDMYREPLAGTQ